MLKPTFPRLISLLFSLTVGLATPFLLAHEVSDQLIPAVEIPPATNVVTGPVNFVVISVPADNEFYIGKQRVDLSRISAVISQSLESVPCYERVVYIKSAAGVRFESLDHVRHAAEEACSNRIEFKLDKKK